MEERGGFVGASGGPGGGPHAVSVAWGWEQLERGPPLAAACASSVGAAVDRSFMLQLPRSSLFPMLLDHRESMRHANACTMRAARGGALDRPFSGKPLEGVLSGFCLPSLTDQPCPVDSADGAGHLQLWSALPADITTSSASWSCSPARQSAIAGCWRPPSRSELLACAGGRDTALWGPPVDSYPL